MQWQREIRNAQGRGGCRWTQAARVLGECGGGIVGSERQLALAAKKF